MSIATQLQNASLATRSARKLTVVQKSEILAGIADSLVKNINVIVSENLRDLERMPVGDPKKDRLLLTKERVDDLAKSVRAVAELPDPSGHLLYEKLLPNGLTVEKISVPLGVVGIIYESRPNVTIDVAALCLRSGNVCLLRGGSDAIFTNECLVDLVRRELLVHNLEPNMVQLLPADRKFMPELLTATDYVDIIIPRGSQQLIEFVRDNATVPVIETGAGVCHTYVESSADIEMAANIITNAKVSRPSVCNSLDTVLIDKSLTASLLKILAPKLAQFNVEIFADPDSFEVLAAMNYPFLNAAKESDFGREYLDFKCSIKCVDGIEVALNHIRTYSSRHSEAIVSKNEELCERFLHEVDAAAVFTNASTRFTDGGMFGLGAEIGISTQKLHARGPFALEKLVTEKWVVRGQGQVRE